MGSQRLKKKNLLPLGGISLVARAIRKCLDAAVFDEVWVNSENSEFRQVAEAEGVNFYQRPEHLGNDQATSEQFVADFLDKHDCDYLFQVHSIAPLLTAKEVTDFVHHMELHQQDALMSAVQENLECAYKGNPINFTLSQKNNSQDLHPIDRIVWAITGWKRSTFLNAFNSGTCATYAGTVDYFPVSRMAGHVIKTQEDLDMAEAMLEILNRNKLS